MIVPWTYTFCSNIRHEIFFFVKINEQEEWNRYASANDAATAFVQLCTLLAAPIIFYHTCLHVKQHYVKCFT